MLLKLKKSINFILNIILPRDAEIIQIENMSASDIFSSVPLANEIKNYKYKAVYQYKNKLLRKAIWAIKYNKNKKIIEKFSGILYEFILENVTDELSFSNFSSPLFIPIPMHKNNLRERGYNQSVLILEEIIKIDKGNNFDVSFDALIKEKETPHQSKLKNRKDRLNNLKNCFFANEQLVKNRNIILIDDVITTGTTMDEASKTLRNAGAKRVIGFSLAH